MKAFFKKNKAITKSNIFYMLWILYAVFIIVILSAVTILPDRIKKKNNEAKVISALKCSVVDIIYSRETDYVILQDETGQSVRFSCEFQEVLKDFDKAKENNETIEITLRQIGDKQFWTYNGYKLFVESILNT